MSIKNLTKNRDGFTFAELLVTGAVTSVLFSIFLPKLSTTMDELAVRDAADHFVEAHQLARAAAISYGRTAEVRIDAEAQRIWVEVDTTLARSGEPVTLGEVVDLQKDGVRLDAPTASVCFDSRGIAHSRGRCSASGMTFEFSKGSSVRTVTTTATNILAP